MTKLKFALAASVLMAMPVSAQALTASAGTNGVLPFLALTSTGPHSGTVTGTATGTIAGGAVYASTQPGTATEPTGTVGNFLSAGPSATSPAIVTFTTPLNYVSFLWGTPDSYNTLTVNYLLNGSAQTASYSPNATGAVTPSNPFGLVGDGTSGAQGYVQFLAGAGEVITGFSFQSPSTNAFESSNFRATAAPGPLAGAGLVPLLGLAGFWFARRRQANHAA